MFGKLLAITLLGFVASSQKIRWPVISAIAATKVFEEVYLMTQGGPADSTRTLVYYVYDQAFAELEISYACTIGLALFLIVLMLSLVRYLFAGDRGLT